MTPSNDTVILDRPFDFTYAHRAVFMIRHRDGRCTFECQCGRGIAATTATTAQALWQQHITEMQATR